MKSLGLLDGKGKALDLGCGFGRDTFVLAEMGYRVVAVDKSNERIQEIGRDRGSLDIETICSDIIDFNIDKKTYSIVIANNIFPFISDKEKVKKIILDIADGLVSGGKVYFTLFGPKDAWSERPNMSFFEYDEAVNYLQSLGLNLFHRSTEEGYGVTYSSGIKFLHIHKFLYTK